MTRRACGRPLRFFALAMAGWIVLRIVAYETIAPHTSPPLVMAHAIPNPNPMQSIFPRSGLATVNQPAPARNRIRFPDNLPDRRTQAAPTPPKAQNYRPIDGANIRNSLIAFDDRTEEGVPDSTSSSRIPPASLSPTTTKLTKANRWRGGVWLLLRPGRRSSNETIVVGQLGASQTGFKVDYDLTPSATGELVAYGRITRALQHPYAPESAIGLSLQPVRAIPVRIAMERRIALGTAARNANSVMAVAGFGPTPIAPGIKAEGYAQAGIVGFKRQDGFIDGKLSLSMPLPQHPIRIGAALSGGAQPYANRLDIGPELQLPLRLPRMPARLSIEWRERIAGHSLPGSGMAITLAADF